jgi:transcriptional/translational regulatory protein YebC/TACO1
MHACIHACIHSHACIQAKIESAIYPDTANAGDILFEAMAPGGVGLLINAESENRALATQNIR